VNVRLRESESKTKFAELLFDPEEAKVIGVDSREFLRGVLQSEGENRDLGAFDVFQETGIGAFDLHPRLFPRNDSGRVFKPVKNTVVDLLHDVIDRNGSAGILETTTAMIAGRGRKQSAIGGEDVEAQKPQLFNNRNQGMKDLLVESFTDTNAEVGEGSLAGDAVFANTCQPAVVLSPLGIVKDMAEVLDGPDSIEIAKQIEKEKRNGIIARPAEDRIGISNYGADEREIDDGSDQLRDASANGAVVVDMDEFLAKFVVRKPASLFLGKRLTVTAVDNRIDLAELSDKIADSKAGGFAHLRTPGVSREKVPPSNDLPGSPFLLVVNLNHPTSSNPFQTKASDSSLSTNAGSTALRSFSCA